MNWTRIAYSDEAGEPFGDFGGMEAWMNRPPLAVGREAHASLPGSRLVVMERCAHAPYFEQPERFNQAVLDFLKGRP